MMKKRPMSNNYGSQGSGGHRRHRYSPGGGSGGGGHSQHRPRKNYTAMREKYLAQARDAMAMGDRVLAENYLQHADHCYRMMMEEHASRPRPTTQETQQSGAPAAEVAEEAPMPQANSGALPAFLTGASYAAAETEAPMPVQNWEERDA